MTNLYPDDVDTEKDNTGALDQCHRRDAAIPAATHDPKTVESEIIRNVVSKHLTILSVIEAAKVAR